MCGVVNTEEGEGDDDDNEEEDDDEDWDWDDEVGRLTKRHSAPGGCNPQVCWKLFGEPEDQGCPTVTGADREALFSVSIALSIKANGNLPLGESPSSESVPLPCHHVYTLGPEIRLLSLSQTIAGFSLSL